MAGTVVHLGYLVIEELGMHACLRRVAAVLIMSDSNQYIGLVLRYFHVN